MLEDPELAYFQEQLLDLLSENLSGEVILARLKSNTKLSQFSDYLADFKPEMVEVAQALVKRWGVRTSQGDQDAQDETV